MKKRVLALLLSAMMAAGLAGCGGSESAGGAAQAEDSGTAGSEASASGGDDYFEETQHLVVAFPTFVGAPVDQDMVTEEINKILLEKHNIEIEMRISDSGSYSQSVTLALAGGEQIDVISSLFVTYPTLVNQGYLIDLEENDLLAAYGDGIVEAIGQEYVEMCRVGGVLYAIPNGREYAGGRGCIAVATEYLDGIGYEAASDEEIIEITEEELEDIFARLHETYPDLEVYRPTANDLMQQSEMDQLGGSNFGVLTDYAQDLTVQNLFESDNYMEFCKRVYEWNQKGYISRDAATDTTAVGSLVKDGVLMAYGTSGKPGVKAQETLGDGRDMTIFQTKEDFLPSSGAASYPWGIAYTTANKEAAMVLMRELFTNPDLADLFIYGIEGVHYVIDEDGLLDTSQGERAGNYSTLPWLYSNQFLSTPTVGNSPDLWEEIQEFNAQAIKSEAAGFAFDTTVVTTELAAVTNIYIEYQKNLEYGFLDPEVGIAEMNEKMMAAGLQTIIDEKQRQLDEWAASRADGT
ncbi:MAG: ABC transporter substrate-binding protein [Eubacteriales bacterium]|nr:ABC transporter substrate-binding protein [Eubacteriales bacterium]